MKILFVSNLYPPQWLGGYEILCELVADEMSRRGHDVEVLTTSATRMPSPVEAPTPDAKVHRLLRLTYPFHEPRPWFMRARTGHVTRHNHEVTARLIRRLHPHVVFVWSLLRLTPAPARAAAESGVPVCHSLNDEHLAGYLPTRARGPLSLARSLAERSLLGAHTTRGLDLRHVTCISGRLRQNLVRRGLPVDHARIIHQGVRLERFPFRPTRTDGDGLRVLYVGQLQPYKGVQTAVEAVHRLAASGKGDITLTIAGDGFGPFQESLRELVAQGPGRIRMIGRIAHDRIAEVYHAHDAFVFPSIWDEPFGLTPLEAMACGLPVVSTVEGGHGEYMRDGDNALVFRAADVAHLAARLARLADDRALQRRLGAAGRETVERGFRFERYVDALEGFLHEARGLPVPLEVPA